MRLSNPARRGILLGLCALSATFVGAAVFGQPGGQSPGGKAVHKPQVAVRKHAIEQAHLQVQNQRKPVPFKKIDLAELQVKAGKKLSLTDELTLPNNKKIKVADFLTSVNKTEEKLNGYGYSLRAEMPKGGVSMKLKSRGDANLFAQQKGKITSAHQKVAPEKDRLAKANIAQHTRNQLPALLKTAQASQEKHEKWRQSELSLLRQVDVAKLTPNEKKLHDHLIQLSNKKAALPTISNQAVKFQPAHASLQNEAKQTKLLLQDIKIVNPDFYRIVQIYLRSWNADWHQTWNWSFGSPDVAEAYINGSLEAHAYDSMLFGSAFHTRGSLEIGGYVLNNQFTVLDALADLSSTDAGTHVQMHAKLLGSDVFPPIDETAPSNWKFVDQDYPWDVTIVEGEVVIVWVPVHYQVGVRGDVHVVVGGLATPTWVSTGPTVEISSSLYASAAVDLGEVRAGVRGSLNLVDEYLQLFGRAAIVPDTTPYLEVEYSAYDRLSLLGGEIDLYAQYWFFGYHDLGSINLFSWGNWTPVDGYVYGPGSITVPLK